MPKDPVTVGPEKHEFLLQKRPMFSGHADRIIWIHRCAHTETQVEIEIEILIEIEIEIEIEIDTEILGTVIIDLSHGWATKLRHGGARSIS